MSEETEIIKERIDLAELIGEYVPLRQAGRYWRALCPFHQEKTPSFIVSPDKGIWHCFGCQKNGDHFSFIQEMEKVDFPEALKLLAEKAGVELKQHRQRGGESRDRRQRLFDLLVLTSRFYHEILVKLPVGKQAREYLGGRGLKPETWENFTIGYAPKSWDSVVNFLRRRGYSVPEMKASGLVGESSAGKVYDRFRGRIVFPIRDGRGRVVAFGGRIVPWHETGEEGKYINSPETELYQKRSVIYNLDRAKEELRQGKPCVVMEGYMDVVSSVQAGIGNVVASSGTAFTDEAIRILGRFTDQLLFAFDADAAGARAALAATERALAGGLRVSTVVLPPGKDPADLAQAAPEKLVEAIANPRPLLAVLLDRLREETDSRKREARLNEILPLLALVANPVYQGELVQQLASTLHVAESKILTEVGRMSRLSKEVIQVAAYDGEPEISADLRLMGWIIASGIGREEILKSVKEEWLEDDKARELWQAMAKLNKKKGWLAKKSPDELLAHLPADQLPLAESVRRIAEAARPTEEVNLAEEGHNLVEFIRRRYWTDRLLQLQQTLADDKYKGDQELLKQFQATLRELTQA